MRWEGQQLDGDRIVLHVFGGLVVDENSPAIPSLAAAARTATSRVYLLPQDVPRFIQCHSDALFICVEAGAIHRLVVDLCREPQSPGPLASWWRIARECRLHSCDALAFLIDLAGGNSGEDSWKMDSLAERYGVRLSNIDEMEKRLLAAARASAGPLPPPDVMEDVLAIADGIYEIYSRLAAKAGQIAEAHGIREDLVRQHGPLGLGPHVQGTIAFREIERHGLGVDVNRLADLRQELETDVVKCQAELQHDPDVKRHFRIRDANLVPKDGRRGKPHIQIQEWLDRIAQDFIGPHGVPIARPAAAAGGASTGADDWWLLESCDKRTAAWHRMRTHRRNQELLDNLQPGSQPLSIKYWLTPRIESQPTQRRLAMLADRRLFRPTEGHVFVLGQFCELELRALAAACVARGDGEHLANIFRSDADIYTASQLQLKKCNKWLSLATAEDQIIILKIAFIAVALRLGRHLGRKIAEVRHGISVTDTEMHDLCNELIRIYPELNKYSADITVSALASNLQLTKSKVLSWLDDDTSPSDLFRAVSGFQPRPTDGNVLRNIKFANKNPDLDALVGVMCGSGALATALLAEPHVTPVGRTYGNQVYSDSCAPHLDLADDVVKSTLFELIAAGERIVGYINQTFLVEVPASSSQNCLDKIVSTAEAASGRIMQGVPVRITGNWVDRW